MSTSGTSASGSPGSSSLPRLDKKGRNACWSARDLHFACLAQKAEDPGQCKETFEEFTKNCPPSWVEHFSLQRGVELRRQRLSAS
uniref:Cytochrome c oxidase assembly factor 6 homolog n=1 Tax=Chromera velia CCMP2878 TaxID=1169474 RepID=A0A0G4H1K9_9ALVE|mmetsp:Transcript_17178/g.34830  ORF Transcript_17178/g.34830 Transcript_17178/m.34830 type:complete len:85 (-) Transcript_17178:35-289(-)|eukprot:Cvel_5536.t1-p1 / transcript=Cvel_5536.t1 / gene=Cvel_5536 / organism=Chromera_velia_CCMP2878 / gene_product=Cytochrome c oxidase assembly factor 6 homolog, putative / transcript_product=Cytochrome c oxidase assembly factor 6 homolog, putative / location=Cvel_scaffold259:71827-74026(+) / protein_length=84 / sequence_SO=supercontig / SO=protein_coding / is_pseudo=false